jgi:hypothetical protein
MAQLHRFEPGGYQFLEGGFPYSQGVIAQTGSRIVRARFADPPDVNVGFARIAAHLTALQRPLTALCAVELRSPAPFSFQGFHDFNVGYVQVLTDWGLVRKQLNPVARSNVCPLFDPPPAPVFHAFCYTVPAIVAATPQARDYVIAGSGEWPEGEPFPEAIVARADLSAAGLAAKAHFVLATMRARCDGLGGDWSRVRAAQIYCVHNIHPLLASHFAAAGLARNGLTWQICRPPIAQLEFEMDLRSLAHEIVI